SNAEGSLPPVVWSTVASCPFLPVIVPSSEDTSTARAPAPVTASQGEVSSLSSKPSVARKAIVRPSRSAMGILLVLGVGRSRPPYAASVPVAPARHTRPHGIPCAGAALPRRVRAAHRVGAHRRRRCAERLPAAAGDRPTA